MLLLLRNGGDGFNPRPSLLTGESELPRMRRARRMFQSTPVIADGRIQQVAARMAAIDAFQSTPVIADGRIAAFPRLLFLGRVCFNPRPSLLTGESAAALYAIVLTVVSIHARHC